MTRKIAQWKNRNAFSAQMTKETAAFVHTLCVHEKFISIHIFPHRLHICSTFFWRTVYFCNEYSDWNGSETVSVCLCLCHADPTETNCKPGAHGSA